MKNLKLDITVISVIVAIVAICVSLITLFFAPFVQPRRLSLPTGVVTQNNIYTNDEFGFQIAFPEIWSNKFNAVTLAVNEVTFLLPTTDAGWQNSIPGYPGYGMIFGVRVVTMDDWNKSVAECKKGNIPGMDLEACEQGFVGKTSQYVVAWFHPQDGPTDFAQYNVGPEFLRANFTALK
jgi:hypothetical protein